MPMYVARLAAVAAISLGALAACAVRSGSGESQAVPNHLPIEQRTGSSLRVVRTLPLGVSAVPPGHTLGDSFFLYAVNGELFRVNRALGSIAWRKDIRYPLDGRPTRDGDGSLFAMSGGNLIVLDEKSGALLNRRRVNMGAFEFTVFPADDGLAFVGSDSSVHLIDSRTGYSRRLPVRIDANPLSVDSSSSGLIQMSLDDSTVAAYFSNTGQQAWRTSIGRKPYAPIGVFGSTLLVGGADFNLYCFHSATGVLNWKVPIGGMAMQRPMLSKGRVFLVTHKDELYCAKAEDGALLWKEPAKNCKRFLTADDQYVLFLREPRTLVLADAATGAEIGASLPLPYEFIMAHPEDGFVCLADLATTLTWIAPKAPAVEPAK